MTQQEILQSAEALVAETLQPYPEYFLVYIKLKYANNFKIYMDGDKGISINQCSLFNRQLHKKVEDKGWFAPGDFSMEVSSPGVDKPLKMHRQYIKNIGREVEVEFNDGTKNTGKLTEVTGSDILLEYTTGKGKKAEIQKIVIPFSNIKTTTVQIHF